MSLRPREVMIPVAGASPGVAAIARIIAGQPGAPGANPAQLDREIAGLLECGLYGAARQAKGAERMLRAHDGRGPSPPACELSVTNPGDVVGLAEVNGDSAQLGLALAMMLFRSQARAPAVIATGALDVRSSDPAVPVRPIHRLHGKLNALIAYYRQPGAVKPPADCFVPVHDPDGETVLSRYNAQVCALADLGVTVRPVTSLAEAVDRLGARRAVADPARRRRLAAGLAVTMVLLVAAAVYAVVHQPVAVAYLPVDLTNGVVRMTPLALIETGGQLTESSRQCTGQSGLAAHSVGERLLIRATVGDPNAWLDRLTGLGAAVVAVGRDSGLKVLPLPPPWDRTLDAGTAVSFRLAIIDAGEPTLVSLVVHRGGDIDRSALESALRRHLAPLKTGEHLSAARAWLDGRSEGALHYLFESVETTAPCMTTAGA